MIQTALDAPRHIFARCPIILSNQVPIPTEVGCGHCAKLSILDVGRLLYTYVGEITIHMSHVSEDASNTQCVKILNVISGSTSTQYVSWTDR